MNVQLKIIVNQGVEVLSIYIVYDTHDSQWDRIKQNERCPILFVLLILI